MRQDYFQNETAEKTFGFKVIITLVTLMTLSIIGIRIYSLQTYDVTPDPTLIREPLWYNYVVMVIGVVTLVGLWFTWQFKKIGVYITIASLLLIILLNPEFSLLRTIAPLFTLFIFVGYGLFEIIPKWQFFK